jgi:signal transduction histidine kinase
MAIKHPRMIRDYWLRYSARAAGLVFLFQVIAALLICCAFMAFEYYDLTLPLWLNGIIFFGIILVTNLILFRVLLSPLKDITNALVHVSGEPTSITPPNPNVRRFEQGGLKPLLELIYSLAATPSEKANPELAQLTTDLTEALNNSGAGFVILNHAHQVIFANTKAPTHVDTENKTVLDLLFEDDHDLYTWLKECEESAVHAERTWQRVANKPVGEEGRKLYDMTASYHKGSVAEVVITLLDRTGLYLPEDEDLDFIAFAAHELRGPITVIRGYLDVLSDELDGKLENDQIELMKRLVVSANRLGSYVNNILNASRYDRRHLKMHLRESRVGEIYTSIEDDMNLRAASQNRILSVSFPDDLPTIAADRASISEVFSNLIDNAIKYSNEGGIVTITARVDGDFVTVSVIDHGIGMPGSVVSNLFHKFYRSHRSRETVAGTGIGLYICKAIVESHGGHISVRSTEGEGSTFEFSLPIYATVADKLQANNNSNEGFIEHDETGWIKNHAMYRG